jgi:5'-nucleotidase
MRTFFLAKLLIPAAAMALAGCASTNIGAPAARRVAAQQAPGPVELTLIAINDFHGNLEPPRRSVTLPAEGAQPEVRVPAGGAAYLASAVNAIRARSRHHLVVSAGDLIGASPLASSLFLDEPTIEAMNLIDLDFNAVGNHEFDRGRAELLRLAQGGCEKHTRREPCALDPNFGGADFAFLAANVVTELQQTLFPSHGMRSFGTGAARVDVAVIGMTLAETPSLVTPAGVAGLSFRDEADTVNALIPSLKAQGADMIVVLIHQGLDTELPYNSKSCEGLSGDLMPVLKRLSPEVDVVVSGHSHQAYICDFAQVDPQRPFLVTSGGSYGTLVTEIRVTVDPRRGVIARSANNHIVQGEGYSGSGGAVVPTDRVARFAPDPKVAALVERYRAAAEPLAARVVGSLAGSALREREPSGESVLGNLIADAQLAATRASGAQIAFMNPGGLRADLVPAADGSVSFGAIYAVQPFGNTMVVKSLTGRQIKAILDQQWASGSNTVEQPNILLPSSGLTYSYDLSRPAGQRLLEVRLNGEPLIDERVYRVAMSNFLGSGGDNFTGFKVGANQVGGPEDIDVLEAYLAANPRLAPPATNRIRNLTPRR